MLCRVLYFIGAVCVGEALYVAMRWGKGEPVSTMLAAVASATTWSLIPLSDAMPQLVIGPRALRTILVLACVVKGYLLFQCKASAVWCHSHFNDFSYNRPIEGSYSGPGTQRHRVESIELVNHEMTPNKPHLKQKQKCGASRYLLPHVWRWAGPLGS